jgi:hypothetical protein
LIFDSINPYETLQVIQAESPEALVAEIKKIRTPIKIVQILQVGSRSAAYIVGDHRITNKRKVVKNGSKNSGSA